VKPVALFAATRWELRALQRVLPIDRAIMVDHVRVLCGERAGQSYWLVQTGIGPEAARTVAAAILNGRAVSAAISTGFACALVPAAVGDVFIANEVSAWRADGPGTSPQSERVLCDQGFTDYLAQLAQSVTLGVRRGSFLSTARVICGADEKRALRRHTGATGLDMESWELGRAAQRHGIPFAVVRTVSDLMDESLPLDFNLFLRPTGWLSGLKTLIMNPSSFVGLNRLRRQSRTAAERLGAVIEAQAAQGFGRTTASELGTPA